MQRLSGLAPVLPDGVSLVGVVDEWETAWEPGLFAKIESLGVVFFFKCGLFFPNFAPDLGGIVFV